MQARLAAMPRPEEGAKPDDERAELEEQLELLRHPLSLTYRTYLEPEIRALEAKVAELEAQMEQGGRGSGRQLAQIQARLAAARQEGDLVAGAPPKDGRPGGDHPEPAALPWAQISIAVHG